MILEFQVDELGDMRYGMFVNQADTCSSVQQCPEICVSNLDANMWSFLRSWKVRKGGRHLVWVVDTAAPFRHVMWICEGVVLEVGHRALIMAYAIFQAHLGPPWKPEVFVRASA